MGGAGGQHGLERCCCCHCVDRRSLSTYVKLEGGADVAPSANGACAGTLGEVSGKAHSNSVRFKFK